MEVLGGVGGAAGKLVNAVSSHRRSPRGAAAALPVPALCAHHGKLSSRWEFGSITGDALLPPAIPPALRLVTFLSPFPPLVVAPLVEESDLAGLGGQGGQNTRGWQRWVGWGGGWGDDLIPWQLVGEGGIHPSPAKPGRYVLAPLQTLPPFFRKGAPTLAPLKVCV